MTVMSCLGSLARDNGIPPTDIEAFNRDQEIADEPAAHSDNLKHHEDSNLVIPDIDDGARPGHWSPREEDTTEKPALALKSGELSQLQRIAKLKSEMQTLEIQQAFSAPEVYNLKFSPNGKFVALS